MIAPLGRRWGAKTRGLMQPLQRIHIRPLEGSTPLTHKPENENAMLYTSERAQAALEAARDWETQLDREVENFLRNPVPPAAPVVHAAPNRGYAPRRGAITVAIVIAFPYQVGYAIGALIGLVLSIAAAAAVIAVPVYLTIKLTRKNRR